MPVKLKESVKVYNRDVNNRMLSSYKWKHFTPAGMKTDELLKLYNSPSYKRKKHLVLKELNKRNINL